MSFIKKATVALLMTVAGVEGNLMTMAELKNILEQAGVTGFRLQSQLQTLNTLPQFMQQDVLMVVASLPLDQVPQAVNMAISSIMPALGDAGLMGPGPMGPGPAFEQPGQMFGQQPGQMFGGKPALGGQPGQMFGQQPGLAGPALPEGLQDQPSDVVAQYQQDMQDIRENRENPALLEDAGPVSGTWRPEKEEGANNNEEVDFEQLETWLDVADEQVNEAPAAEEEAETPAVEEEETPAVEEEEETPAVEEEDETPAVEEEDETPAVEEEEDESNPDNR